MRYAHFALVVTGILALAGCVPQERVEATAPTVTYEFDDEDDYDVIAEKADLYCEEEYGLDAELADQDGDDDSYEATFACK